MNDIKPTEGRARGSRVQHRPIHRSPSKRPGKSPSRVRSLFKQDRTSGQMYFLVRTLGKVAADEKQKLWDQFKQTSFAKWPDKSIWHRAYALAMAGLFVFSTIAGIVQPLLDNGPYKLTDASRAIIPAGNEHLATLLSYKAKNAAFLYNDGYKPAPATATALKTGNGDPRFSASFSKDANKGVSVTDAYNNVNFKMTPKFGTDVGKQDKNQIVYPLNSTDGYLVYTAQVASVKEDIVLQSVTKDTMTFEYDLGLDDGLQAKLEKDGSVGIYGSALPLYGNVATGSDKDADLLKKAKDNAPKTKFLFGIPAPVVKEADKQTSSVIAGFELNGNKLKVTARNLKAASYPLTIDPSIYVQTAAQLMNGNNETNVAFDVATEQFKKGFTTGARINAWTETGAMNDATYDQSVATAGGYIYRAGGRSGRIIPYIAEKQTTVKGTASTTTTLNMTTNRPSGDLYIATFAVANTTVSAVPGGWTLIKSANNRVYSYYHVGGAGEPSSYAWTTAGSVQATGTIMRIKNADTSGGTLSTWVALASSTTGTTAPVSYPATTPGAQGTLVMSAVGEDTSVPTSIAFSPTGYSDVVSTHSTGTAGAGTAGMLVSTMDSPPLSGVSSGTATVTNAGITSNWGSVTFPVYGLTASAAYSTSLEWAHFNSSTGSIDSPAPGSNATACSGWCSDSAYNLPSTSCSSSVCPGLVGMSLVAYNGYLYAIGGNDGTNLKSTVYIAKLGSNGEPSLWHPTDADQTHWSYWYKDSGTYSATTLQKAAAYAYNGRMYLVGGDTNATNHSGATNVVKYADILPNGTLGSWSSGANLPTQAYGVSVQAYNGYLYAVGGNNNGTMLNTVSYSHLNSDGSMNTWQTAAADGSSTFTTARAALGGTMISIWGGYLYLAGGCSAVDATTDYCSTIASDVQLASINADGTLDIWNTMANIKHQRFGSSFVSWQGSLYRFGGCSRQDVSTGDCYATHIDIQYGNINQDGDASTVSISQDPTNGNCVDPDPYDCSLPPGGTGSGQGGQMLVSTAILNGFIYVIGGCTTYQCTTMTANTSYAAIDSNGRLKSPPTCAGGTNGSWCVDSTNQLNTAVGGAAITVFGGYLYIIGGTTNNTALSNDLSRNKPNADGSLGGAWVNQNIAGVFLNNTNLGFTKFAYGYAYARANPASAGTVPGNLFLFGGCTTLSSGTCSAYTGGVYKCRILTDGSIDDSTGTACTTTGQQQIGTVTGASGAGLGAHSGAVYANYIYLIGGSAPGTSDLTVVRYAKFDNSNNIVAVSGGAWIESGNTTTIGRSRGAAFGYNGYLYVVGGYNTGVATTLKDIQFAKINVSDGSIGQFSTSIVTINQRWGLGLAVSNSYAYVIGGCTSGAAPTCASTGLNNTVQTFQMYNNDSGAPGQYSVSANLYDNSSGTTDRIGAGAAVYNGYMYIAGGCTGSTECASTTTNVQKGTIDANGAITGWTATGITALPAARGFGQLEIAGGTLYFIGGQTTTDSTAQSTIYYATFGGSGSITAWTTATKGIGDTGSGGQARTQFSSAVWNNRIYVTGGYSGSAVQTTVFVSPQLNSGGDITSNWTSSTAFTVARSGQVAITYANNIYILAGYDGTNYLSDVQFAKIDSSNGTVGSWTYSTNLPSPVREADGFASNGYMYVFGGRSSLNDCSARTLIAPISANTTIASGNNPTGVGEWYQTNRNFDGGRYGVSAVNYQGKSYLLGGGCQGIVMQDDFDSNYDSSQWSATPGFTASTTCQSTSTSNTFSGNANGNTNYPATKSVDVSSGGTVYFKLYIPLADVGSCFKGEGPLIDLGPDNVALRYCTATCGSPTTNWTQIGGVYNFAQQDPLKPYIVTIPAGAQTASTRFGWFMSQSEGSDSYALEDVYIVANGNNGIAYASNSRVTQTSLLSQPQTAIYSRQIDAGSDVFPTKWLMNGLDNSIGARWQFRYRSMNDPLNTTQPCGGSAMSAFGQETNYGDVTLGNTATYTVKDGSGTNIGCGRYFFMTISIDASQTYGYPDDITRGPTLDNLTLFYNSNPGKRLIHGKTFTEGIQQPLDTQP